MAEPMSAERLAEIQERVKRYQQWPSPVRHEWAVQVGTRDMPDLLAEVERLRAELAKRCDKDDCVSFREWLSGEKAEADKRARQAETERDQARAEVERLRAELTRDRESLAHISHEAADLEGFAVDIGVKLKQAEAERDQARADVKALAVEVDQLKAQLETESAAFYLLRDERDHLAKQAADRDGIVSALRVILQRNGMPDGVRQEITDLIGSATGGQS